MSTTATITRLSRTSAMAALFVAGSVAGALAQSDDYSAPRSWRANNSHVIADGNLVDVGIRVDGQDAPLFFKPGQFDRHYFQAFKGRNYSLVLRNNTGRRVGVLIAVDGLNAVNGELSRLSHDEPMYVIDPHEEAVIRGWRTSLDDVRRFVFVDEERSYAERTNQSNGDLGWIRVLAFREMEPLGWWDRLGQKYKDGDRIDERSSNKPELRKARPESASPPMANEMAPRDGDSRAKVEGSREDGNPGTGWGEQRHDPVRRTEFRAMSRPTDQIVLRYEYLNGLRALGIFPRRNRTWDRDEGNLGFAQPPRW